VTRAVIACRLVVLLVALLPPPVRADGVVGTGTVSSVTRTPSRTPTPTRTPNTTPTWTPQETGCLYVCRGGNWHGQPCGRDADCPGGICTWGGHQRVCLDAEYCTLSGAACGDNADCPLWPAQADFCNHNGLNNTLISCTGDRDCGRCAGGTAKGWSCLTDANCPASTCARGTGKCINGVPQSQYYADMGRGTGAEGDGGADYMVGEDECIEADMAGAPSASTLGLVTGVGVDSIAGRLWVSQMGERGRVSIWNSITPASGSSASAFVSARDDTHATWSQLFGDLTIATSGYLAGPMPNSLQGTGSKGHAVRDPVRPSLWMPDYARIVRLPDDAGTDQVFDSLVLGHKDLAGTPADSSDGRGIFTAIAIAQRCVGGSQPGWSCAADADCEGGGSCKVQLAATDICGMVNGNCTWNGRVMVWTDLEAVTAGQAADIPLATGGSPAGLAFVPGTGDLVVSDTSTCSLKEYASDFDASASPYATVGGCGNVSDATMVYPTGVAASSDGSIIVADTWNNRALKFAGPALMTGQHAAAVLGQPNFITNAAGASSGTACDRLHGPLDVAFGPDGATWVADSYNHRALRFEPGWATGEAATTLLGQSACTDSYSFGADSWSFAKPNFGGIATFPNGGDTGVILCDSADNRCLVHNTYLSAKGRGAADAILGQADAHSRYPNRGGSATLATLWSPTVPAADNNHAYIADAGNNRVLQYTLGTAPNHLTTGQAAVGVYGGSCTRPPSATSMCGPTAAVLDPDGNLLVVDSTDGRIMLFCLVSGTHNNLCTALNSGDSIADDVYGRSSLTEARGATCTTATDSTLCVPGVPGFLALDGATYMLAWIPTAEGS
jgi:hypothetical protein